MDRVELNGRVFSVVKSGAEAERATGDVMVVKSSPLERAYVVDAEARILRQPISDASVDRDGDVVALEGWDFTNWLRNPVVMFGHDYTSLPIARGVGNKVWTDGGMLWSDAQYASADLSPFADQVYRMKVGGYLRAASVGFLPSEMTASTERDAGYDFTGQELLEWSDVPIPANANAVAAGIARGELDPELLAKMGMPVERERIKVSDSKDADDGEGDPQEAIVAAAAAGDLEQVRSLVGSIIAQAAEVAEVAHRAHDRADAAEAALSEQKEQNDQNEKEAPGSQPAERSAAASVPTDEEITKLAAAASAAWFETHVLGRV